MFILGFFIEESGLTITEEIQLAYLALFITNLLYALVMMYRVKNVVITTFKWFDYFILVSIMTLLPFAFIYLPLVATLVLKNEGVQKYSFSELFKPAFNLYVNVTTIYALILGASLFMILADGSSGIEGFLLGILMVTATIFIGIPAYTGIMIAKSKDYFRTVLTGYDIPEAPKNYI